MLAASSLEQESLHALTPSLALVREGPPPETPSTAGPGTTGIRLLDQVRVAIRLRHYIGLTGAQLGARTSPHSPPTSKRSTTHSRIPPPLARSAWQSPCEPSQTSVWGRRAGGPGLPLPLRSVWERAGDADSSGGAGVRVASWQGCGERGPEGEQARGSEGRVHTEGRKEGSAQVDVRYNCQYDLGATLGVDDIR